MSGAGDIIDGRFELMERLGSGGMGAVWRARDTALEREVALKEVRPDLPLPETDAEGARVLRERVLREARALARLSHPNVVTIHHIVDADPHPWLVMELLPGDTLQDRLAPGPLPPPEVARIGRDVLSALAAAHAAGIHHRDVKPANVLLRPNGSAVLTDFGIAAIQGSATLTATGDVIGSPEYIAPERIRGRDDLPASDLWSLGMLMYVAVEGVSPMRRGTTLATLAAVLDDPVPPPSRAGQLTPALTELLVRDPCARPDIDRLDTLLLLAVAGEGHAQHPQPPAPLPPSPLPPSPSPSLSPARTGSPRPDLPPYGTRVAAVPGPPAPVPAAARAGRRTALTAAAAVVAGALVATGVYLAVRPGGSGGGTDGKHTASSGAGGPGSSTAAESPGAHSPDGKSPGTAPASPEESRSSEPPPSLSTSPTTPPPDGVHAGDWIAQLFSEPVASGTATRDRGLAAVREQVPGAVLLRSDDFASLRPGYWVVHAPMPFTGGAEAIAYCAEHGRTTKNECVGRYLSHDEADRALVCLPATGGGTTGRCTSPVS